MSNAENGAVARRGLSLCNPDDGTFVSVDPTFAEIHGYDQDELVGKHVDALIAPEYRSERPDVAEKAISAGHLSFDTVHQRKDGSRFPARVSIIVASAGNGAHHCSAAVVEDLSGRSVTAVQEERVPYDASRARERYRLTLREIEVLRLVAAGKTDKDIAKTLGRSPYTIHNHVRHILLKMGASSRTDATVRALREGLV